MTFNDLLAKDFVLLDGAMGTVLQNEGLLGGALPELLNIENPSLITDIHARYIKSGAQIIYTNTFGANRFKLNETRFSPAFIIDAAIKNARSAALGTQTLVALDIGPTGKLLEPLGPLSFDEAYDVFKEQIIAGKQADIIAIETMTDLNEIRAALLAAKENSTLPVICTMTFEENMHTFSGCSIESMAYTLEGLGADALGINCSLGPKQLQPAAKRLLEHTSLPVIMKPNAGLPDPLTGKYDVVPAEFAEYMAVFAQMGVRIFGGCCGTTPEFITKTKEKLTGVIFPQRKALERVNYICSAARAVALDVPRVIGERINPTGKKLFKKALIERDIGYIINQAKEQEKAGADILDVNVGLPEINEKEMMLTVIKALCGATSLPLQIDSADPAVLEAALRIYPGKAIVNSVNGEEKSMAAILPIVKKYGAAVVALTLDENGIPKTSAERVAIAKRILNCALSLGIKRENVFIDCLTLTASAEQDGAAQTLKAVRAVKHELGLKTVLGVSNISFGLPSRETVNSTFLSMALENGLDFPILNPNSDAMMGVLRSFKVLAGIDRDSADFIGIYGGNAASPSNLEQKNDKSEAHDLKYAVKNGLVETSAKLTASLLGSFDALDIVNSYLIPALDDVGADFETNKIFLPQLILAANAAQAAFLVIKENIKKSGAEISKGKIILATVKGDIHDIGKNIVKVLLENYGYDVIDLGRDVDASVIVETAKEQHIRLVGLSALMTVTLSSMEDTIKHLRHRVKDIKIMVGGAVLTADYAAKIGADYYAKDAKGAVDIAKSVFV